ncbi:oligopeptide/dipeptide ABC transporter ATP-binding protein [Echinimonas agarilytica]|uniref:ATP-binding cassette domain-containing protein n=1 Tax=Echinimonas agarilytica TaxID=1215918 RepID=A0AA42B880_9GAMM|nr:oligopeptide/dipeptide ABC transporter ATP-binding protein [Echinimonas agarilytica]MCM2680036.1 ATP-binding cassette domain-containing protein [Echinimonas agarilytica]
MNLLDIRNLTIELDTPKGRIKAVDRFSIVMQDAEIRGLVGESGSGKSLVGRAIMGLLPDKWHVKADRFFFGGEDLQQMSAEERRLFMGQEGAMIFQQPSTYLDPSAKIGEQLLEALPLQPSFGFAFWKRHTARHEKIAGILHKAGIRDHKRVMNAYAHELSEGLCQKIMIAMAIANEPRLLIADEPTSTMEAITKIQIYKLLAKMNQLRKISVLHISNELETAANWTDRVTVMYCGQVVEAGPTQQIIKQPFHPYTYALASMIKKDPEMGMLNVLPGTMPTLQHLPTGCRLGPRCPRAHKACIETPRTRYVRHRNYRCHTPLNLEEKHANAAASGQTH